MANGYSSIKSDNCPSCRTNQEVTSFDFNRSFNPPSWILLKFTLYKQHIKLSKNAKFQVLTPYLSWVMALYKLSTFAITNYWMLSKRSYLFNKLTKSVENWYLTFEAESKKYIILFLFLFFSQFWKISIFDISCNIWKSQIRKIQKKIREAFIDHKLTFFRK